MALVCHVILQDHVINGLRDFKAEVRGTVELKIKWP